MKKTLFPLIERTVGTVTYEHTVVQKLYMDVFIGDAERNYYVDRYHEVNLCVHYNVRKPGTYSFTSDYQYYLTDGRMSLKLHWSLGIPVDEMIIEKYDSLNEAKDSRYYKDFCDLKQSIDKEIERQKKLDLSEYKNSSMCTCFRQYPSGESYYTIWEMPYGNEGECLQFHFDERTKEWKMSKSPCSIITLWNYLRDFDEVNEKELHLMEFIPMENGMMDENSPYYEYFKRAKNDYEYMQEVEYC